MHTLNPFVCGTFHYEDDEPCRKYNRKKSRNNNNNPYSTRGLDKFSALLSDLDEKRQKIYSQMNPHDISFVRFVHSNTNDFIPVIVKVKNKKDQKRKSQELRVVKASILSHTQESTDKSSTESTANTAEERERPKIQTERKSFFWNMKKNLDIMKISSFPVVMISILLFLTVFGRLGATICTCVLWCVISTLKGRLTISTFKVLKKPSFYLPVVTTLILLLLTVLGRSLTTLCICVLWYAISAFKDKSSNQRKSMEKKEDVRVVSEKKVVANEGTKKKNYVRGLSEKMEVAEGSNKKKDFVRWWSEKKIATSGLLSPRRGDSETSKNKIEGQQTHKKSR